MSWQSASSRKTWRVRGTGGSFLIVKGADLHAGEAGARVPWKLVLASLKRGSSSLLTKSLLRELYAAATGIQPDLQLGSEQLKPELLDRYIEDTFNSGALVALSHEDFLGSSQSKLARGTPEKKNLGLQPLGEDEQDIQNDPSTPLDATADKAREVAKVAQAKTADPKQQDHDIALRKEGKWIASFGRVQPADGSNFRDKPDPNADPTRLLEFNTRVFVSLELPNDWYFVRLDDGTLGYVPKKRIWINPPEPNAYLYKIKRGEGAQQIAKQEFLEKQGSAYKKKNPGAKLIEWGKDERHYVNVLYYSNLKPQNSTGRSGISKPSEEDSWDKTATNEGVYIWIPSIGFAMSLMGKIPSGSITYEAWKTFKVIANMALDYAVGHIAFSVGMIHGALESVWDLVVGLFELVELAIDLVVEIWELLKSLFTTDLMELLKDLWDWVQEQNISDLLDKGLEAFANIAALIKEGIDAFLARWNDEDFLKRWHFRGWVVGYAIAEIVMEFFTAGLAAVKWVAKGGKLVQKLKGVSKVVKFAEKGSDKAKKLSSGSKKALKEKLEKKGTPTKKSTTKNTAKKEDTRKKAVSQSPYDITSWPPPKPPPKSKSPKVGEPYAAEYRFQRYRYDSYYKKKKKKEDLLDFEKYKETHYKTVLNGGRPGRKGGPDQVRTRKVLEAQEGFTDTETTLLNGRCVDLFKHNELGGIDYVEVDEILKRDGIPKADLREKLKEELAGLKKNDRLIYVDKKDSTKRIIYNYGDDPSVVDTRKWNH